MDGFSTFLSQITRHTHALRKLCGSWGKREIKDQITKSLTHLTDNKTSPSTIDFAILLDPYFTALSLDHRHFHLIVLDCFSTLFVHSGFQSYPNEDLTTKILSTVLKIYKPDQSNKILSDEAQRKLCKIVSASFTSPAGKLFIHGNLLQNCFTFFLDLHSKTEGKTIKEVAAMTVQEELRVFIERYSNQETFIPDFQTIPEIAQFYKDLLIKNAVIIVKYGVSHTASISDVDMIVLVRVFTTALVDRKYSVETLSICADALVLMLEGNCTFLDTPYFINLLRTDIHVALLSLALDTNGSLADVTSRLILTIWRKFAKDYLEGLNEVIDRGIATALGSPTGSIVRRTLRIFRVLVKEPQFLVDAFVNYDCDHSGFFRNIFENSVCLIGKSGYPGGESPQVQRAALDTLVAILESLWEYFVEWEARFKIARFEEREDDAQDFLTAKKAKDIFDQGIDVFKRSPKKGLAFFVDHQIVEDDIDSIATFLFNTPSLDPQSIGEILGGPDPRNIQILRSFVNHFNFKNLSFEAAFRQFLSKFQIPGEAQMIDRVMEQFGSKFYNDNTDLFSCADTVYVLAFSTLMLHTDAHHPNVKQRMTLDEFLTNNKGIDGGKDLPYSFLENLFKGITSEKINLTSSSLPHASFLTRQQKSDLYKQQCAQTLVNARESTHDSVSRQFHRAESPNLIGPMYHSIWGGILGALTISFDRAVDREIVNLCLRGFKAATHIAAHCYVEDALKTMIDSFATFTRLQVSEQLDEKNLLCVEALVVTSIHDRNFWKGGWEIVLGVLSALFRMPPTPSTETILAMAEELFTQSRTLDRESILNFSRAMCTISYSELRTADPHPYLLLKFDAVAFWNMDREMYSWTEIWSIIGSYLSREGYSVPEEHAVTIVDVIRQLSCKFLSKQEMTQFHFQRHFLRPFLDIYDNSRLPQIRELVLDCVESLALGSAADLHSGWDVFFRILSSAAVREGPDLKLKAFNIVEHILVQVIKFVRPHLVHLMGVIRDFVKYDSAHIVAVYGVAKFVLVAGAVDHPEKWVCLLQNVADCLQHNEPEVRQCAEETLVSIATAHGCMRNGFSNDVWRFFLRTTLPELVPRSSEEISHTRAVLEMVWAHLITKYDDAISEFRDDVLMFLTGCCECSDSGLRDFALQCVQEFVSNHESSFVGELMELLVQQLKSIVPKMTTAIRFVNVIECFIDLFEGKSSAVASFMDILKELSIECQKVTMREVHSCWCASRVVTFTNLIGQMRSDEMAIHLKESLELFKEYRKVEEWNSFMVKMLGILEKVDNDMFDKSCGLVMRELCLLIETESKEVRKQVTEVLRRLLAK
jgi:hypothetical protein